VPEVESTARQSCSPSISYEVTGPQTEAVHLPQTCP